MADFAPHWLDLSGRVCVVTGAGSGIGAAVATALAQAGARVALLDLDADKAGKVADGLLNQGFAALAIGCDTSDPDSVQAAAARVVRELGPCHGVVNNAGMMRSGSLADVELADWNRVLAVNLTGYLLVARAFRPQMLAQGGGSLVHIASIAAVFPQTHSGAYSASKSGVLLLSKQLAAEWGGEGIRSNAICPGMIRTPLTAAFYQQPGVEEKRAAATTSRRVGEAQDIADAALYLLSPRASYVNATELLVDGGMAAMMMDMVPRPGFAAGQPARAQ